MIDKNKVELQLDREDKSKQAGLKKLKDKLDRNKRIGNAAVDPVGNSILMSRHEQIIQAIEFLTTKNLGSRVKEIKAALERVIVFDTNGKLHNLQNVEVWAYIGLQEVINNIFNPNLMDGKIDGKHGGFKNIVAKMDQSQLELHVGKQINNQMSLLLIKECFPHWFRCYDEIARGKGEELATSPAYWKTRMGIYIERFADKLAKEGDIAGSDFVRNRRPWSNEECRIIGELVVSAVLMGTQDLFISQWDYEGKKKRYDIVLTPKGQQMESELFDLVSNSAHDLMPMLVEPHPVTNESAGGWFHEVLQEPRKSRKGDIHLSGKHLEFINRQAKVQFEINPYTYQLMQHLKKEQKPLGKFDYRVMESIPNAGDLLGAGAFLEPEDRQRVFNSKSKDEVRDARHASEENKKAAIKQSMKNVVSSRMLDMTDTLSKDDWFYIPMQYDFRGRIYSRVPFVSFQGTDAGKYLLRFYQRTPIDDRTEHWLKVGIANAAGNDKKSWDDRIKWFDKHKEEIVNIGRLEHFSRAYDFLTQDTIDDPFCLAALANEYVKVFVDKEQDYTQVFVTVDASCSGTSIFNAWRRNKQGALKTNLIDTPAPADIYMAVWEEIKRIAPPKAFRASFIKRLEKSKLLRKMMKETYVPASYASPPGEQLVKLKAFNTNKLVPAGIGFKDQEIKTLMGLWSEALDNVSSINTVVEWFKARTREALAQGSDEIRITSCNGSQMTLKYPRSSFKSVPVIGMPGAKSRRKALKQYENKPFIKKLLNSITANVTHMTDAAALCEALWDWEVPFVAIHDAVGMAPGKTIDEGIDRMKRGLITATEHNIWNSFRQDNNLPLDSTTAGPVIGDLDLELIMKSNYMFS